MISARAIDCFFAHAVGFDPHARKKILAVFGGFVKARQNFIYLG
jgi:hypothetical protein